MRKYLSQIIGEATERLPKQNQVTVTFPPILSLIVVDQ